MTLAELKRNIDELSKQEAPETPVEIWLMSGRTLDVGKVAVGIYTNDKRTIGIQEH